MNSAKTDATGYSADGNYLGMSGYELAYLVSIRTGDALKESLAALKLDPSIISPEILAAAASSLLARSVIVVHGEDIEATGIALPIIYTLTEATRWTKLALESSDGLDGAILIEAPLASALFQPRMLGAWLVTVLREGASSGKIVRSVIDEQVTLRPGGAVYIESKSSEASSTLYVRRSGEGEWELAAGASDTNPEIRLRPSSSAEVDTMLAGMLSTHPEGVEG